MFAVLALVALMLIPASALAQSAAPTPANSAGSQSVAPASPAQAPGAAQPPTAASASAAAAGSAAPTTGSASAAASAPAVRGLPTPVGSNLPPQKEEGLSFLAYILIFLAGIWFLAAIVGIVRLLMRPPTPAYAAAISDPEKDRPFLSFIMPFGALITVAIIVSAWGVLFLWLSSINETYTLAVDVFVVCLVMLIATILASRGGAKPRTELH